MSKGDGDLQTAYKSISRITPTDQLSLTNQTKLMALSNASKKYI